MGERRLRCGVFAARPRLRRQPVRHPYRRQLLLGLGAGIHFDKVSDDNYFRDLSTSLPVATQVYLYQSVFGSYAFAPGWVAAARGQHTQVLSDPTAEIPPTPQYDRVPQLTLTGLRPGILGSDFLFASEL